MPACRPRHTAAHAARLAIRRARSVCWQKLDRADSRECATHVAQQCAAAKHGMQLCAPVHCPLWPKGGCGDGDALPVPTPLIAIGRGL